MPTPRKVRAEVANIERCTDDLFVLHLAPLGKMPPFKAGHFLQLAIDDYDPAMPWPESRAFSIANSPKRAKQNIRLIYSKVGVFTERMINELRVGSRVWLRLPYGDFHMTADPDRTQILLAGGSGISPFVSFLEQAIDERFGFPIALYYGVRTSDHLVCMDVIEEAASSLQNFSYQLFIEHPRESDPHNAREGRLSLSTVFESSGAPERSNFYISGPPAMIDFFKRSLSEHGIDAERIFSDDW